MLQVKEEKEVGIKKMRNENEEELRDGSGSRLLAAPGKCQASLDGDVLTEGRSGRLPEGLEVGVRSPCLLKTEDKASSAGARYS
jgi:hypothetical protein